MVKYYPKQISIAKLIKESPEIGWVNHAEEQRLQDIADLKARGKGTPKKARSKGMIFLALYRLKTNIYLIAEESRRLNRKRKGG